MGTRVDDPVNRVDAWGLWTVNVGGTASATGFGVGGTASTSIGRDGEGTWSWQNTVGAGPAAGYGVSGGLFGQATNATRMDDLAGEGTQVGWGVGDIPVGEFKLGRVYGVDKVSGDGYDGLSGQIGIGAGTPEVHTYKTSTSSNTIYTAKPSEPMLPDDFDLYNRD